MKCSGPRMFAEFSNSKQKQDSLVHLGLDVACWSTSIIFDFEILRFPGCKNVCHLYVYTYREIVWCLCIQNIYVKCKIKFCVAADLPYGIERKSEDKSAYKLWWIRIPIDTDVLAK